MKKIIKRFFIYSILVLGIICFSIKKSNAQQVSKIKHLNVSFDSTLSNSPLRISGELLDGNAIKGLRISISDKPNGKYLFNDTLFIVNKKGSFFSSFHNELLVVNGRRLFREIPVNISISGLLFCKITLFYKDGTREIKMFRIKNKS